MHLCIPPWSQNHRGVIESKKRCVLRRERIHPFRPVTSYKADGRMGKCCAFCENIPFNAPWRLSNIAERINPFPTKRINIFSFKAPAQNHYPDGMHKCIPYELLIDQRTILLRKADIQIIKFLPCWVKPICTK